MTTYENALKRLVTYRKTAGLTQAALADMLNISQEVYSCLENGKIIISGQLLLRLDTTGLSLNSLITGKSFRYKANDLEKAISSIPSDAAQDFVLKLIAEIIVNDFIKSSAELPESLMLLSALCHSWNSFSLLCFVRSKLKLSQINMAERLGLGIKKYRALERENIYPDAEILSLLYDISGYEPALFMNMPGRKLQIVKSVWENLAFEKRAAIIKCISALKEYITAK